MKNTLNYKRTLMVSAKHHIMQAKISRVLRVEDWRVRWERSMIYARQAIRMAGVL